MRRPAARLHARVYRLTRGRMGARIGGQGVLLLETVGRRTGKRRVTPVQYLRHGESCLVVASDNGGPRPPAWSLNLRASPRARVTLGARAFAVAARAAEGEERRVLWRELRNANRYLAAAEGKAGRELPVIVLTPAERR